MNEGKDLAKRVPRGKTEEWSTARGCAQRHTQETLKWPAGFSKLGLPELTATEKAEILGSPAPICLVSQSVTLAAHLSVGR